MDSPAAGAPTPGGMVLRHAAFGVRGGTRALGPNYDKIVAEKPPMSDLISSVSEVSLLVSPG